MEIETNRFGLIEELIRWIDEVGDFVLIDNNLSSIRIIVLIVVGESWSDLN